MLKQKFQQSQYQIRLFFKDLYVDILKKVFSQRFVRMRKFWFVLYTSPFFFWSYIYESQQYNEIRQKRAYKKHVQTQKILFERMEEVHSPNKETHYLISKIEQQNFPK